MDKIQSNLEMRSGLSREESRIADLVFAFNNREMLLLLKKRGSYLSNAKMDKAEEIEKKMTALKDEKYDSLVVPNTFFCTF